MAATVAVLAVGVAVTATASASIRSCATPHGLFNFGNDHQEYLADLSARNMTCRQALADLHRAAILGWPPKLRLRHFSCAVLNAGGGGATVRCVRRHPYEAFRVTIGT